MTNLLKFVKKKQNSTKDDQKYKTRRNPIINLKFMQENTFKPINFTFF
jgi:hypothetical protein